MRKHESYFEADWRRRQGGGPLLINAIHDIDCLRFLCGDIESVQAIASSAVRGHEVEDTAAVIMRFENGALGVFFIASALTGRSPAFQKMRQKAPYWMLILAALAAIVIATAFYALLARNGIPGSGTRAAAGVPATTPA